MRTLAIDRATVSISSLMAHMALLAQTSWLFIAMLWLP